MRYQRWAGEVDLVLGPLGLVLKAGRWYVVARVAATNALRAFRVSRILELDALGERFERPSEFDLDTYWRSWSRHFETGLYHAEAVIRLSPRAFQLAPRAFDPIPAQAIQATATPPDDAGWREAVLPIEGIDHAVMTFLRFGAEIEVMAPPRLRQAMRETTATMADIYSSSAVPHQAPAPGADAVASSNRTPAKDASSIR